MVDPKKLISFGRNQIFTKPHDPPIKPFHPAIKAELVISMMAKAKSCYTPTWLAGTSPFVPRGNDILIHGGSISPRYNGPT